jgi:YVTN family beta-propeller protein
LSRLVADRTERNSLPDSLPGSLLGLLFARSSLTSLCLGIVFLLVPNARTESQTVTATITAGTYPTSAAVNPVTNKVYVSNSSDNTITVIDGVTNATTTVTLGYSVGVAVVNPMTNKVYFPTAITASRYLTEQATRLPQSAWGRLRRESP